MTDDLGTADERRRARAFGVVWAGQLVSIVGSSLTTFALGLWVYSSRGSVTDFALVGFSAVVPRVLLSPVAGVVVDRGGRRRVMLLASGCGAGVTLALAALVWSNRLDVWHVYVAAAIGGALASFEWPAWAAATSTLVPARHLGRASGMVSLAQAVSDIAGPILAAALIVSVGIGVVLAVDLASFACACLALALVRFPEPRAVIRLRGRTGHLFDGLRYIAAEPSLALLAGFVASVTFQWGIVGALIAPMVLDMSSAIGLGQVLSAAGFGALSGSALMAVSGGGRRRVRAVFLAEAASGVTFVAMGIGGSLLVVAVAAFLAHVTIPIIEGSALAIWQERVPLAMQGRVFSARQMIERLPSPLAYLVAGPLAERVFEPGVGPGGPLGVVLRPVFGGDLRGIGILFAVMGIAQIVIAVGGFASRRLRDLDRPVADLDRPVAGTLRPERATDVPEPVVGG